REVVPSLLPDITGIHYVTIETEEEIYQKLSWSIQYGLRELDLEQDEIIMLSLDHELTKQIIDYYETTKNGQPIVIDYNKAHHGKNAHKDYKNHQKNKNHSGSNSIRIASVQEFHGREARFIIVIGIKDFNDPEYFDAYYNALTR